MVTLAQHEEVIRWGPDCNPAPAYTPSSLHLFRGHRVMAFEGLPIYTTGPPGKNLPGQPGWPLSFLMQNGAGGPRDVSTAISDSLKT